MGLICLVTLGDISIATENETDRIEIQCICGHMYSTAVENT